jgi:hypothetical protein
LLQPNPLQCCYSLTNVCIISSSINISHRITLHRSVEEYLWITIKILLDLEKSKIQKKKMREKKKSLKAFHMSPWALFYSFLKLFSKSHLYVLSPPCLFAPHWITLWVLLLRRKLLDAKENQIKKNFKICYLFGKSNGHIFKIFLSQCDTWE